MSVAAEGPDERSAISQEPVRKRRRLIPRFRLRTLFVAAVLMSLLLGWYGRHVYRVRQERAAAESLRRVGADLTMPTFEYAGATLPTDLYGLLPWLYDEEHTYVTLESAKGATDADLQHLGRLRGLKALWLIGDDFTDDALRHARGMKRIEELSFTRTSITGKGLAEFEGRERLASLYFDSLDPAESAGVFERIDALPNLTLIQIREEPLTVEGMRTTATLRDLRTLIVQGVPRFEPGAFEELSNARKLEELSIQTSSPLPFGDEELATLCKIESLQTLELPAPQLTDAGFAKLGKLPKLRRLYISDCRNVTDAGVETVAGIETLEEISLEAYGVTDKALESLRELPTLKKVVLPACVSREAAQRFATERADCEVWYDGVGLFPVRIQPQIASERTSMNDAEER